jgi:hypothetical protein
MEVLKFNNCSFKVDHVLSYTRKKFIKAYLGRNYFKGANQEQRLDDLYSKCMAIRGVSDSPPEIVIEQPIVDDNSTNESELGEVGLG